eukprot:gene4606-7988_t
MSKLSLLLFLICFFLIKSQKYMLKPCPSAYKTSAAAYIFYSYGCVYHNQTYIKATCTSSHLITDVYSDKLCQQKIRTLTYAQNCTNSPTGYHAECLSRFPIFPVSGQEAHIRFYGNDSTCSEENLQSYTLLYRNDCNMEGNQSYTIDSVKHWLTRSPYSNFIKKYSNSISCQGQYKSYANYDEDCFKMDHGYVRAANGFKHSFYISLTHITDFRGMENKNRKDLCFGKSLLKQKKYVELSGIKFTIKKYKVFKGSHKEC